MTQYLGGSGPYNTNHIPGARRLSDAVRPDTTSLPVLEERHNDVTTMTSSNKKDSLFPAPKHVVVGRRNSEDPRAYAASSSRNSWNPRRNSSSPSSRDHNFAQSTCSVQTADNVACSSTNSIDGKSKLTNKKRSKSARLLRSFCTQS